MYIVYLTIYTGNKLPLFYIGSTSLARYNKGYVGSVSSEEYRSIWNEEKKANLHLFKTKIISRHDTREAAFLREKEIQKKFNVVRSPMYANRTIARCVFYDTTGKKMNDKTRQALMKANLGVKRSESTKEKMRLAWIKRKNKPVSSETRDKLKIARSRVKMTKETCEKISTSNKGRKFTDEHRANISASRKKQR